MADPGSGSLDPRGPDPSPWGFTRSQVVSNSTACIRRKRPGTLTQTSVEHVGLPVVAQLTALRSASFTVARHRVSDTEEKPDLSNATAYAAFGNVGDRWYILADCETRLLSTPVGGELRQSLIAAHTLRHQPSWTEVADA